MDDYADAWHALDRTAASGRPAAAPAAPAGPTPDQRYQAAWDSGATYSDWVDGRAKDIQKEVDGSASIEVLRRGLGPAAAQAAQAAQGAAHGSGAAGAGGSASAAQDGNGDGGSGPSDGPATGPGHNANGFGDLGDSGKNPGNYGGLGRAIGGVVGGAPGAVLGGIIGGRIGTNDGLGRARDMTAMEHAREDFLSAERSARSTDSVNAGLGPGENASLGDAVNGHDSQSDAASAAGVGGTGSGANSGDSTGGSAGANGGTDSGDARGGGIAKGGAVKLDHIQEFTAGGPNKEGVDDGLVNLDVGEFVIKAKSADYYGADILAALNNQSIPVEALRRLIAGQGK